MTVVLAFDPGSRLSAWALLESRGIAPKPITVTILQWGMEHSRREDITRVLDDVLVSAPDVLVIEAIEGYAFKPTNSRGGGQAVVKALIETAKVEGMIRECCASRGEIVDIAARQWRKSVCGKGNAKNATIKAALERCVYGLPRTNPHVRDAIGAGVAVIWARGGRV